MYRLAVSTVVGLAAPKPPSQVSAGTSISCRNSTSGLNSISGSTFIPRPPRARDRVTMAEAGPAPGRVTAMSDRFPRALGRNPTRRTDRCECDLRYGLDQSPYRLPAIIVKLLTDLGKFEQTAEAICDFPQLPQAEKQRDFYVGNVGIKRGNLTLPVRTLSAKPGNVACKMRYLP